MLVWAEMHQTQNIFVYSTNNFLEHSDEMTEATGYEIKTSV